MNLRTLIQVAKVSTADVPLTLAWSPDGLYLAVGSAGSSAGLITVYDFNGTSLASVASAATQIFSGAMSWSPNGRFIAYSDSTSSLGVVTPDPEIVVLEFTGYCSY